VETGEKGVLQPGHLVAHRWAKFGRWIDS